MMTVNNQQVPTGHSSSDISIPCSYIDAYKLHQQLASSIEAKQAALEIWLDQAGFCQVADTDQARKCSEFTVLADQYELDLIVEALTVAIQHSAMRDFCNILLRLPVTDEALQMIAATDGQVFETVSYERNGLAENTYIPSILGIYVAKKVAVMASVGAFATMTDKNLQKLKQHMMAAALSLPDYFNTDENVDVIRTIHLALIDCKIKTSIYDKHIWSLKDIDQLIGVTGSAEAIQQTRVLLSDHVQVLLNRVADEIGTIEQVKPLKEPVQPERRAMVRVAFLAPYEQGPG